MWANKNAGDATKWTYEPDLTRQSRSAGSYGITSLRLTIQVSERNKIGAFWDEQKPCSGSTWSERGRGCRAQPSSGFIYGGTPTFSPEAGGTGAGGTSGGYSHGFQRVQQITWSSPVSNRFLIDAGFGTYLSRYGSMEQPGNPTRTRCESTNSALLAVRPTRTFESDVPRRTGRTTGSGPTRGAHRLLMSPGRTT